MMGTQTLTDAGARALVELKQDTQIAAGARAMIRRAMVMDGYTAPSRTTKDAPHLATWAVQHPDLIAPRVAAGFERAAQAWVRGNNSGNNNGLAAGERECNVQRRMAALVCGLFGIERVDFPGLYPTFHRAGRTWYTGDEARALRGE